MVYQNIYIYTHQLRQYLSVSQSNASLSSFPLHQPTPSDAPNPHFFSPAATLIEANDLRNHFEFGVPGMCCGWLKKKR